MKKTWTMMALLAAWGAAPQGMAQSQAGTVDDPLTGKQTERIEVQETRDIYISGDVVFDGMRNAGAPSGASICMGPDDGSLPGGGPLDVCLIGLSADRTDNLTFSDNLHLNVDHQEYGGAVGCSSVSLYIRVYFEHLNKLIFDNDRLVNQEAHSQACGGGSVSAMYTIFEDIGYLEFKGTYEGGDVAEAELDMCHDVNATFGGAIRAGALWFDGVDELHMNQILTACDYLGGSAFDIGSGTSYIYNCGYVDFSGNTTLYDKRHDMFPAGSVMDIDTGRLFCAENYRLDADGHVCGGINISNNYACNYKILHFKANNYKLNNGLYAFFLNGDFTYVDNRAGVGHAGMELFLIPLESPGLLLLAADLGDITFRGNIGGVNQEQYAEELASGREPVCTAGRVNRMENVANSVVFGGNFNADDPAAGDFRAVEGHAIHFYDPIRMKVFQPGGLGYLESDGEVLSIRYNTPLNADDSRVSDTFIGETYRQYYPDSELTYGGTIHFSGEYYQETDHTADSYLQPWASESDYEFAERLLRSRWSTLLAKSTLWDGEFLVEKGAIYGDGEYEWTSTSNELVHDKYLNFKLSAEEDGYRLGQDGKNLTVALDPDGERWEFEKETALEIQKGALAIRTEGIVIAKNISFSGHDAILRTDHTSRLIADRVDMSKGVCADFGDALNRGIKTGLTITANTLDLGTEFTLGVPDHTAETPGAYYRDKVWQSDQTFVVFDASRVLDKTELEKLTTISIVSVSNGSNVVDYEDGNQGEWRVYWGEDDPYVLYAEWTNTEVYGDGEEEQQREVTPEREGMAVENSLWSAMGNAKQLQEAAMAQVSRLRFGDHHATRFWSSALGEYERVNADGGVDGYEYSGEGYAVGADHMWKGRYLAGVGFGQMFGRNRGRCLPDVIEQDSIMATVYGAVVQELSPRDAVTYSGSLTYGWTDNELSSWQGGAVPASGEWDAETLLLKAEAQWSRRVGDHTSVGVSLGLEYGHASREAFRESGVGGRCFDRSSLAVLSVPIQGSVMYESSLQGTPWLHQLHVAYIPDLYRENPRSAARDEQGYWDVRGVAPGRHGFEAGYATQWAVSDSCTLYAGYSFEFRETGSYHRVHAGVSVGF